MSATVEVNDVLSNFFEVSVIENASFYSSI